jgi:hypothetical protein
MASPAIAHHGTTPWRPRRALTATPQRALHHRSGRSTNKPRGASPSHETVLRDAHFRSEVDFFAHPSRWRKFSSLPFPSATPALFDRLRPPRLAGSCTVLRCPLTCAVNGQQHSTSCFVCNPQYHGLVQGGAHAPAATGGAARARPLPPPLPPRHSAPPPLWAPKALRRCGELLGSCFVWNPQYHGLVQGGAHAPATGGVARARLLPLPLSPRHPASPPFGLSTKEMRITT